MPENIENSDWEPVACDRCGEFLCICPSGEDEAEPGTEEHLRALHDFMGRMVQANSTPKAPLKRKARFPGEANARLFIVHQESIAGTDVGYESSVRAFRDVVEVADIKPRDRCLLALPSAWGLERFYSLLDDQALAAQTTIHSTDMDLSWLLGQLGLHGEAGEDGGLVNFEPGYLGAVDELYKKGVAFEDPDGNLANRIIISNARLYDRVIIASGDESFEMAAVVYQSVGIPVTVVSRRESLSSKLAKAATEMLHIPNVAQREEQLRLNRVLGFRPNPK